MRNADRGQSETGICHEPISENEVAGPPIWHVSETSFQQVSQQEEEGTLPDRTTDVSEITSPNKIKEFSFIVEV